MRRNNLKAINFTLLVMLFGLVACKNPVIQESANGNACAVSISVMPPDAPARTVVPSVNTQIAAISISLVDSKGSVFSVVSGPGIESVIDVYPGDCTISAQAFSDTARTNLIASGSKSVTAISGETVSTTISLTLSNPVDGNGSLRLPISFPSNLGITSVSAAFADGSATAFVTDADYTAGTATLTAPDVPKGPHIIAVSFKAGAAVIGCVYEAINIRTGLISNRWVDGGGNLLTTRVFTVDELYTSTRSLASLTVAGVSVPLVSGTTAYPLSVGALDSLTFSASAGLPSQSLAYTWNAGNATAATGSIASDAFSPALSTIGANTLKITVTASDRQSTLDYTITITRKWTVSFNVKGGGTMAPITVENGQTVAAPATPTYTGFTFEGWYADAAYTTPFTFGSGGTAVTGNSTIYAKWTETGIVRVTITLIPGTYQTISTIAKASVRQDGAISISATCTIASADASWAWYLDGTLVSPTATNHADTAAFSWSPGVATSVGEHAISCVAKAKDTALANGIAYSGSGVITVLSGFLLTYDGNGADSGAVAAYDLAGTMPTTTALTNSFTRPNYDCYGWNTSADGSGTFYAENVTFTDATKDTILYAQWKPTDAWLATQLKAYARKGKVYLSWSEPSGNELAALRLNNNISIVYYENCDSSTDTTLLTPGNVTGIPKGIGQYVISEPTLSDYSQYKFIVSENFPNGASTSATIYAIPGLGTASISSVGSSFLPECFVPAKKVYTKNELTPDFDQTTGTAPKSFWMAQTEIPYPLWYEVYNWALLNGYYISHTGNSGSTVNLSLKPLFSQPVTTISRRDAIVWCNALTEYYNAKNGTDLKCVYYTDAAFTKPLTSSSSTPTVYNGTLDNPYIKPDAKGFRLPTLTEWENASRYIGDFNGNGDILDNNEFYPATYPSGADAIYNGTATSDYDGDGNIKSIGDVCWYSSNQINNPNLLVATKAPNILGLFDMNGNVSEMVQDIDTGANAAYIASSPYTQTQKYSVCSFATTSLDLFYNGNISTGFRVVRNAN